MKNIIFNKHVAPLYLSSLAAKTGDFSYEVLFALMTIALLNSDTLYIGIVYFFRFLPYLFFGPAGGWLADAAPQKYIMLFSDALRLVTIIVLGTLYAVGTLNIYILTLCSMAMTLGRSLSQPSFRACLPRLLDSQSLPAGNSFLQVIEDVASIIGPLACSLVIVFSDKGYVIALHAICYATSLFFLCLLEKDKYKSLNGSSFSFAVVFEDTKNTFKNLRKVNRELLLVIAGTAACVLFTASLLRFVLPNSILNIYKDEALVGYLFSAMSLGTVLGGICYTKLIALTTPVQLMHAWIIYGVLFFAVAVALNINLSITFVVIIALGLCGAIVDISIITNIQTLSAPRDIGKNYGLFSTIANSGEALSGLLSGLLSLIAFGLTLPIISLLITAAAKTTLSHLRRNEDKQPT